MFHAVHHVSGGILWANLHLLFWLSLVPFVTGWMDETHFAPLQVAAYGAILLCAACAYTILTVVLVRNHGKDSLIARALGADLKGKISLAIYVIAIGVAFLEAVDRRRAVRAGGGDLAGSGSAVREAARREEKGRAVVIKLYRFDYSPFVRKVQMVLDLIGTEYEAVDVPYGDRTELVELTGGYVQVPVLLADGEVITDSRNICRWLVGRPSGRWLVPADRAGACGLTRTGATAPWRTSCSGSRHRRSPAGSPRPRTGPCSPSSRSASTGRVAWGNGSASTRP